MVFYKVFLLAPVQCNSFTIEARNSNSLREFEKICKRLREFEEIKISQGKAVEGNVTSNKENS
jgi:hypothetical protein